jgi:methionine sulfoxide reductase heme-binding subunit
LRQLLSKIWKSPWYPGLVFTLSLLPLLYLVWKWQRNDLGINSIEYVSRFLGLWTLRFLLMTLAVTPLRRLPSMGGLIKIRRMLGLFTFFYGCIHGWHYFAIDAQWNRQVITEDLTYRRFFIAGFSALVLMVPLAATSFDRAIRWMGGRRWTLLHRLIYVSGILAVVHYWWQAKTIVAGPVDYAAVLLVLFLARILWVVLARIRRRDLAPVN